MASQEEIRNVREEKIAVLKKRGILSYPSSVKRSHEIFLIHENFDVLSHDDSVISAAGRIIALRGQGAIKFIVLDDGTGHIQAVLKRDIIGEDEMDFFENTVDIGDFISVSGTLFKTQREERSILFSSWEMATKSLLPLPEKWHGLVDPDERFRKRYLDLAMSQDKRELFRRRAKFWQTMRSILIREGFLEVETPTLEITTGGAEAEPFRTHHNDFDMDVFLRISIGELWQKRLLAGGLHRTFEIGREYRNEGSSAEHLQEFTNMEFYASFEDYRFGMDFTKQMYREIAKEIYGKTEFTTRSHTFDLAQEWSEIEYAPHVLEVTGVNVLTATEQEMKNALASLNVSYTGDNRERLTDTLWKYCRKNIAGPAFVIHHPKIVSPLSKTHRENSEITERFQIILAGSEVGNGFSELNDPHEQRERFMQQQRLLDAGDLEAMMPDWEYVEMLEHGMPPACGFGCGERLFAFFEDLPLREVTLFPLMKQKI